MPSSIMVSPVDKMFSRGGPPSSPCPTHYGGHLATMTSADFCLITQKITSLSAISLVYQWLDYSCDSIAGLPDSASAKTRTKACSSSCLTGFHVVNLPILHVKQISPDKCIHFLCTAASFTVAVRSHGFVALCQLASSLRLI